MEFLKLILEIQFLVIKILVDGAYCKLLNSIPKEVYTELSLVLSYLPDDYQWRASFTQFGGDGRVRMIKRGKFPTGLLPYVEQFCLAQNHELVLDYQVQPAFSPDFKFDAPKFNLSEYYVLRDYQEEAIQAALEHKRGMLQCPTGSGKSLIAARLIEKAGLYPALVCLTSKDLLKQTVENYEAYLGVKVGKIAAGKFDIKPITVAMVQTLNAAINKNSFDVNNYLRNVKCLLIDECHHQVATTVQNVSYRCSNAEIRIGGSGTPCRENADDMEIEAALGPVIYKLTVSDLIKRGTLVKPTIYMFNMPTRYKTKKPYPQYSDVISDYVEGNFDRNTIIAKLVKYLLDGTNRNCLVLCNRINHGEMLESLIPGSVFVSGDTDIDVRSKIFEDFKKKKLKVLIATSIIDEGWDCPNLDSLVLAHPYKSVVKCFQRIGRALRNYEGKQEAIIVDFYDKVKYLDRHAQRRLALYASEPEFEVIHKELNL